MISVRLLFSFLVSVLFFQTNSAVTNISAGDVHYKVTGLNRGIATVKSRMEKNGVMTTVIKLKPRELLASKVSEKIDQDYIPVSLKKDVVENNFWDLLRDRLSGGHGAKTNMLEKKNITLASNQLTPSPILEKVLNDVELSTDERDDDHDILSLQEREELETFNQSIDMQSRYQQQPTVAPTIPVATVNADQAMMLAMQMQMSAQALSNQATALMMNQNQRGQQTLPIVSAYMPQTNQSNGLTNEVNSVALPRQDKMSRLMGLLNQIMLSGVYSMQRLLVLIDLEIDVIERLLAGETGSGLEMLVQERNKTLTQSIPLIVSAYDSIIDLATTDAYGESDSRLYHYFVRSGKKQKMNQSSKKKFLLAMMYAMKHYQEMIESMYNVSRSGLTHLK